MTEQYSAVTWTTAELLTEVRAEARIPDNAATDAEILREATFAIWTELHAPLLTGLGESAYDVQTLDLADSGALGREANEYLLPAHCTAESISHVVYYDTLTADTPAKLPNIPLQQFVDYDSGESGTPAYWSFRAGRLAVTPAPSSSSTGYVRIFYQRRHPELVVSTNNVDTLTAVDTSALTVTVNEAAYPSNWDITVPGNMDVYSSTGPHRYYATDVVLSPSTSGQTIVYVAPLDPTPMGEIPVFNNAYVTIAGKSAHVHLPPEFRKPLNLRVASYLLRQIGDEARANSMLGEFRVMMQTIQNSFQPRGKNAPQRIVNQNSVLRGPGGSRRRYR